MVPREVLLIINKALTISLLFFSHHSLKMERKSKFGTRLTSKAKKYKIRLTVKRKGKRVYKTLAALQKEISKKEGRRKARFGVLTPEQKRRIERAEAAELRALAKKLAKNPDDAFEVSRLVEMLVRQRRALLKVGGSIRGRKRKRKARARDTLRRAIRRRRAPRIRRAVAGSVARALVGSSGAPFGVKGPQCVACLENLVDDGLNFVRRVGCDCRSTTLCDRCLSRFVDARGGRPLCPTCRSPVVDRPIRREELPPLKHRLEDARRRFPSLTIRQLIERLRQEADEPHPDAAGVPAAPLGGIGGAAGPANAPSGVPVVRGALQRRVREERRQRQRTLYEGRIGEFLQNRRQNLREANGNVSDTTDTEPDSYEGTLLSFLERWEDAGGDLSEALDTAAEDSEVGGSDASIDDTRLNLDTLFIPRYDATFDGWFAVLPLYSHFGGRYIRRLPLGREAHELQRDATMWVGDYWVLPGYPRIIDGTPIDTVIIFIAAPPANDGHRRARAVLDTFMHVLVDSAKQFEEDVRRFGRFGTKKRKKVKKKRTKRRKVHFGSRGGRYVIKNGRKKYV